MKTITIIWSDEDQCYIATVDEYPSLSAHGDTPEEAREMLWACIEEVEVWPHS